MSLKIINKIIALTLVISLAFEQSGFAQVAGPMAVPAYINGYVAADKFRPLQLRSLTFDRISNNFDFYLDKGDIRDPKTREIKENAGKLAEYFQIGLRLPNSVFWVNLRPDAQDQVIDPWLEKTDLGKVMLEADLQLKKDMAAFTSPRTTEGKNYWEALYNKAGELYGQSEITIPTLTRPWIVPGEILIRETEDNAYIYKATLNVMLEQDYLKDAPEYKFDDPRAKALNEYSSQLIRREILPKLTREINSSRKYAGLRQVYYSLILAQWFKQSRLAAGQQAAGKIDSFDLNGLTSRKSWSRTAYFKAYQKSFARGEYKLQETVSRISGASVRQYTSGGERFDAMPIKTISSVNPAVLGGGVLPDTLKDGLIRVSGDNISGFNQETGKDGGIAQEGAAEKSPSRITELIKEIKKFEHIPSRDVVAQKLQQMDITSQAALLDARDALKKVYDWEKIKRNIALPVLFIDALATILAPGIWLFPGIALGAACLWAGVDSNYKMNNCQAAIETIEEKLIPVSSGAVKGLSNLTEKDGGSDEMKTISRIGTWVVGLPAALVSALGLNAVVLSAWVPYVFSLKVSGLTLGTMLGLPVLLATLAGIGIGYAAKIYAEKVLIRRSLDRMENEDIKTQQFSGKTGRDGGNAAAETAKRTPVSKLQGIAAGVFLATSVGGIILMLAAKFIGLAGFTGVIAPAVLLCAGITGILYEYAKDKNEAAVNGQGNIGKDGGTQVVYIDRDVISSVNGVLESSEAFWRQVKNDPSLDRDMFKREINEIKNNAVETLVDIARTLGKEQVGAYLKVVASSPDFSDYARELSVKALTRVEKSGATVKRDGGTRPLNLRTRELLSAVNEIRWMTSPDSDFVEKRLARVKDVIAANKYTRDDIQVVEEQLKSVTPITGRIAAGKIDSILWAGGSVLLAGLTIGAFFLSGASLFPMIIGIGLTAGFGIAAAYRLDRLRKDIALRGPLNEYYNEVGEMLAAAGRDGGTSESARNYRYSQILREVENEIWRDPRNGYGGRFGLDKLTESDNVRARSIAQNRLNDEIYGVGYGPRYHVVNGNVEEIDIARDGGTANISNLQGIALTSFLVSLGGGMTAVLLTKFLGYAELMGWAGAATIIAAGLTGLFYEYAKDRNAAEVNGQSNIGKDGGSVLSLNAKTRELLSAVNEIRWMRSPNSDFMDKRLARVKEVLEANKYTPEELAAVKDNLGYTRQLDLDISYNRMFTRLFSGAGIVFGGLTAAAVLLPGAGLGLAVIMGGMSAAYFIGAAYGFNKVRHLSSLRAAVDEYYKEMGKMFAAAGGVAQGYKDASARDGGNVWKDLKTSINVLTGRTMVFDRVKTLTEKITSVRKWDGASEDMLADKLVSVREAVEKGGFSKQELGRVVKAVERSNISGRSPYTRVLPDILVAGGVFVFGLLFMGIGAAGVMTIPAAISAAGGFWAVAIMFVFGIGALSMGLILTGDINMDMARSDWNKLNGYKKDVLQILNAAVEQAPETVKREENPEAITARDGGSAQAGQLLDLINQRVSVRNMPVFIKQTRKGDVVLAGESGNECILYSPVVKGKKMEWGEVADKDVIVTTKEVRSYTLSAAGNLLVSTENEEYEINLPVGAVSRDGGVIHSIVQELLVMLAERIKAGDKAGSIRVMEKLYILAAPSMQDKIEALSRECNRGNLAKAEALFNELRKEESYLDWVKWAGLPGLLHTDTLMDAAGWYFWRNDNEGAETAREIARSDWSGRDGGMADKLRALYEEEFILPTLNELQGYYDQIYAAYPGSKAWEDFIRKIGDLGKAKTPANALTAYRILYNIWNDTYSHAPGKRVMAVRVKVIEALGELRTEEAIDKLMRIIFQDDYEISDDLRYFALAVLARTGNTTTLLPKLEEILVILKQDPKTWHSSFLINDHLLRQKIKDMRLLKIEIETTIKLLKNPEQKENILKDRHDRVWGLYKTDGTWIKRLHEFDYKDFEAIYETYFDSNAWRHFLNKISDLDSVDSPKDKQDKHSALYKVWNDSYSHSDIQKVAAVRAKVIETLGRLGTEDAIEKLMRIIFWEDYQINDDLRYSALAALAQTGNTTTLLPKLEAILATLQEVPEKWHTPYLFNDHLVRQLKDIPRLKNEIEKAIKLLKNPEQKENEQAAGGSAESNKIKADGGFKADMVSRAGAALGQRWEKALWNYDLTLLRRVKMAGKEWNAALSAAQRELGAAAKEISLTGEFRKDKTAGIADIARERVYISEAKVDVFGNPMVYTGEGIIAEFGYLSPDIQAIDRKVRALYLHDAVRILQAMGEIEHSPSRSDSIKEIFDGNNRSKDGGDLIRDWNDGLSRWRTEGPDNLRAVRQLGAAAKGLKAMPEFQAAAKKNSGSVIQAGNVYISGQVMDENGNPLVISGESLKEKSDEEIAAMELRDPSEVLLAMGDAVARYMALSQMQPETAANEARIAKFADYAAERKDVSMLIQFLYHRDPAVRKAGAYELGRMYDKKTFIALRNILRTEAKWGPENCALFAAIVALSSTGWHDAIPELRALLFSRNENIRSAAIWGLHRLDWEWAQVKEEYVKGLSGSDEGIKNISRLELAVFAAGADFTRVWDTAAENIRVSRGKQYFEELDPWDMAQIEVNARDMFAVGSLAGNAAVAFRDGGVLDQQVERMSYILALPRARVQDALADSVNKTMLLNDFAESVGVGKDVALKNMISAGIMAGESLAPDFYSEAKLNKFIELQVASSSNPAMVDLTMVRIERIILNSLSADKFVSALFPNGKAVIAVNILAQSGILPTVMATWKLNRAMEAADTAETSLTAADVVDSRSAGFYRDNGVDIAFSLPAGTKVKSRALMALKDYQRVMMADMARGQFNYRGTGTRQTVEQFFNDYFMPEWYGRIRGFVEKEFNGGRSLKAIVTNGIGANDQFMWSLVEMYNRNRPEGAPVWYHIVTARDLAKLNDLDPENTLCVEISRSGSTWEGVEAAIRMVNKGFTKRITLANGGALADIAKAPGVTSLIVGMSPDIGGRNMHRKTSIYYTAQTVIGMFLPEMDSKVFAGLNNSFDAANDFANPENAAAAGGKFLNTVMKLLNVEHIALVSNSRQLALIGSEWSQYVMEGSNKEDVISLAMHDLSAEPAYVLENLALSPAGKISAAMVLLDKAAPSYVAALARVEDLKRSMPAMVFTIDSSDKTDNLSGISRKQQAAFDILWTDMVTVLTSLLRVDANSNPNVKVVREMTASYVAKWQETKDRYDTDPIGKKETDTLLSVANPGTEQDKKIGTPEKQKQVRTLEDAARLGREVAAQLREKGMLEGRNRLNIFFGAESLGGFALDLRNQAYAAALGKENGWIMDTGIYPLRAHKGHEATLAYSTDAKRPLLANKSVDIFLNVRKLGSDDFYNEPFRDITGKYTNVNGANVHQTNDSMTLPNIQRAAQVSPTILFEFEEMTPVIQAKVEAFYRAFINEVSVSSQLLEALNRDGGKMPTEERYSAADPDGKVKREDNDAYSSYARESSSSSSGEVNTGDNVFDGGKKAGEPVGGVDFRALPAGVAPMFNPAAGAGMVSLKDLDKQWSQIQSDICQGRMPYQEIKQYVRSCCGRKDAAKRMGTVCEGITNILKMEEDRALPTAPELKEILSYLG